MATMFDLTPNLQRGIRLVNDIDIAKFPRILSRVIGKVHLKTEAAFNEQEFEQLQGVLGLPAEDLNDALITCSFLFQQAAYLNVKPKKFGAQLIKAEMNQDKAEAFYQVWEKYGESVSAKLTEQGIAPKELASLDWRLSINAAQDDVTKLKGTQSLFQFNIRNNAQESAPIEKLQVEFTQDQLLHFYNQLETIQQQLDVVQQ